jgi:hypothetical protein
MKSKSPSPSPRCLMCLSPRSCRSVQLVRQPKIACQHVIRKNDATCTALPFFVTWPNFQRRCICETRDERHTCRIIRFKSSCPRRASRTHLCLCLSQHLPKTPVAWPTTANSSCFLTPALNCCTRENERPAFIVDQFPHRVSSPICLPAAA